MEELSLSGEDLYDLMESFFKDHLDCHMKIQCRGGSMAPFIRDKSIVTLKPYNSKVSLKKGDIVAAAIHEKKRIIIHRIISGKSTQYKLKGDNNKACDGWFHKDDIIGVVERIENIKGFGYAPRSWQNKIIALSSRVNALKNVLQLSAVKFLKQ